MGLIPHIYRRAAFPQRATPLELPLSRGKRTLLFDNRIKFDHAKEAESVNSPVPHFKVIASRDAFKFHASHPKTKPLVKFDKLTIAT